MAAPHVAGSLALLAQHGRTALAAKALLINSTSTPGRNSGWSADWGWGFLDMASARTQSGNTVTGTVAPSPRRQSYVYYKGAYSGQLRATLVWRRHIGPAPGYTASPVSNLDLVAYDPSSGAETDTASSYGVPSDNVEQLWSETSYSSAKIFKVKLWDAALPAGVASEAFAVAFSQSGFTVAQGPVLTTSCAPDSANVEPSSYFFISCTVSNTGDATAFNVQGAMTVPSGFKGPADYPFFNVAAGTSRTLRYAYQAPSLDGSGTFRLTVDSTSFGEPLTASAQTSVVAGKPAPSQPSPYHGETGVSLNPVLRWTGVAGLSSYDVYFGPTASPDPKVTNSATKWDYTPGTLSPSKQYWWKIVGKLGTATYTSPVWTFTTGTGSTIQPPPSPGNPSPGNGVTISGNTPTFSWSASTGATHYDVYIGSHSGSLVKTTTVLAPATSVFLKDWPVETWIYWKVVARNSAGDSSATSAEWKFYIPLVPPDPPVLTSPAAGAANVALNAGLSWKAARYAASYDVYFGTTNPPPMVQNTTSRSYSPQMSGATTYYWYVVAKNTAGTAASSISNFRTVIPLQPPGAPPALQSPADGASITTETTTLTWSAAPGATSYDVFFGTEDPLASVQSNSGTTYTTPALAPGKTYFWYVVGKNAAGALGSDTRRFTTPPPPPPQSPVLTISKTHAGSFRQSGNGAYSIAVSNFGAAATTGMVTVTDNLPQGLTLVSMTGSGWTCSGLTCTRSDVLQPGASYPAITLSVNVAAAANSAVTNQATVSGGNSASASASDPTTIDRVDPPPGNTLWDFNNGSTTGWTSTQTGWAASGGVYRVDGPAMAPDIGRSAYWTAGMNWTDYTVSAKVRMEDGWVPSATELILRFQSDSNYLACRFLNWQGTTLELLDVATNQVIASTPVAASLNEWYTLRASIRCCQSSENVVF